MWGLQIFQHFSYHSGPSHVLGSLWSLTFAADQPDQTFLPRSESLLQWEHFVSRQLEACRIFAATAVTSPLVASKKDHFLPENVTSSPCETKQNKRHIFHQHLGAESPSVTASRPKSLLESFHVLLRLI